MDALLTAAVAGAAATLAVGGIVAFCSTAGVLGLWLLAVSPLALWDWVTGCSG